MRHFAPVREGERTRRHQMTTEARDLYAENGKGNSIVTMYEVTDEEIGPRLYIEIMVQMHTHTPTLTVEEAAALRDACDEFVKAWSDSDSEDLAEAWARAEDEGF